MGSTHESEKAMKDLVYSAINPNHRQLLMKAGALDIFVSQLRVGSPISKSFACQAIGAISSDEDIRSKIGESKAIANLLSLLNDNDDDLKVASLQTLGNLMHEQKNQLNLIALAGVNPLTAQLSGSTDQIRRIAAGTIGNIGIYPDNIHFIYAAGAIPKLVDLLRLGVFTDRQATTVEIAVGALRNLVQVDSVLVPMLETGIEDLLVELLTDPSSTDDTKELCEELQEIFSEHAEKNKGDGKQKFKTVNRSLIDLDDEL